MRAPRSTNGDVPVPILSRCRPWLLGGLAALAAAPAAAADAPGRYSISPAEGGIVRLDRETGAMSFCSGSEGSWTCRAIPETESALKKRIEELEADKRALEAERRLRDGAPTPGPSAKAPEPEAGEPPVGDVPPPPGDLPVPTERDVDKLFDYVEGMVRKFKERIERLEREAQKQPEVPL
jgi:hypothetical protein